MCAGWGCATGLPNRVPSQFQRSSGVCVGGSGARCCAGGLGMTARSPPGGSDGAAALATARPP